MNKSEAGRIGNAAARAVMVARGEHLGGPATPTYRAEAARILAARFGVTRTGKMLEMDRKTVSKVVDLQG